MEELDQNKISAKEAETEILSIRQDIALMGSNDYEIPTIDRILERMKKGEIDPEKALEETAKIRDRKADYH